MKPGSAKPGDTVRFTGDFLRNTGQIVGSAGLDRWVVRECHCALCGNDGRFICTNEPHHCQEDPTGYEDLAPEDRPKWKHLAAGNVEKCAPVRSRR